MKAFKLLIALSLILVAGACQKVIDVDLNDADPKIVIEANFNGTDSTVIVKVSYTSSFFDEFNQNIVNNAVVTITDGNGISTGIPSSGNGMYELSNYIPTQGMTYTINVTHDGTTYSATSKLNAPLTLLEPTTEFYEQGFFGEEGGYLVFFTFNDPVGLGNYYNVIYRANDTLYNKVQDFVLGDDELTDGNFIERPIFDYFEVGDSISFELQAIDKRVYDYYSELQTIAGGQSSAAPANPYFFWSNQGLGYFSAYYSNERGITIVE